MIKKTKNQRFLACPNKNYLNKRGQLKISFGMIFSVILIVIFIFFAFYAIQKFLGFQKGIQVGQFINSVQVDVDKMWKGSHGIEEHIYFLPTKIDYVCFTDFSLPSKGLKASFYKDFELVSLGHQNNLFFYPISAAQGLESSKTEHINIQKITINENPYCIPNTDGKVKITIKMDLGDSLVTIQR